jgi:hypothetical protein
MVSDEKRLVLAQRFGGTRGPNGIKVVEYNGIDLVFRRPQRHECREHLMKLEGDPAEKIAADEQLAQLLIVVCGDAEGPAAKIAFLALLDEYPYLTRCKDVAGALARLTGAVQDEAVKDSGTPSKASATTPTDTPRA